MAIEVKFCTAKRTHVPVGPAKFDVNWCNESPLRGKKPDFWPASKFNTDSLPLRGILPVTKGQYEQWNCCTRVLPVNCISHSRTLSICIELRSLRSSYSSFIASSVKENVARPREASRPAKTPYGPPVTQPQHYTHPLQYSQRIQSRA